MAKTTRIAPNQPTMPAPFPNNSADQIRTVGLVNFAGADWICSRCGTDIEVGHMYRTENRMRRHVVCPRRRR